MRGRVALGVVGAAGLATAVFVAARLYELDHLVSLELGGAPAAPTNLWPEPYASSSGARTKDRLENRLHTLVCRREVPLREAQNAIATNWMKAYDRYV
jgi:hypothetical protein